MDGYYESGTNAINVKPGSTHPAENTSKVMGNSTITY